MVEGFHNLGDFFFLKICLDVLYLYCGDSTAFFFDSWMDELHCCSQTCHFINDRPVFKTRVLLKVYLQK